MTKVKDILSYLEKYKKIVELTDGVSNPDINIFLDILKPYRALTLDELEGKISNPKKRKAKSSSREESLHIGELYYKCKINDKILDENQITSYLDMSNNKILLPILELPFENLYEAINKLGNEQLTSNQLYFLGMALLNIKLKGSNKANQKKNLLDILWTVSENQEMNEIYESAL